MDLPGSSHAKVARLAGSPVEADLVITGASELLVCPMDGGGLGPVVDGAIAAKDGRIVWVGPSGRLADRVSLVEGATVVEAGGHVVMPGLVECHTHLIFAGDRSVEFQARIAGASYQEVALAGGGIASTVRATRAASDEELCAAALGRLDRLLAFGVTTVEAKSGYGLSVEQELRALGLYARLDVIHPMDLVPTLLGACSPRGVSGARSRLRRPGCYRDHPRRREARHRQLLRRLLRGRRVHRGAVPDHPRRGDPARPSA